MLGALQGIRRMQLEARLRLLDVFADHVALEQRDLALLRRHHQDRHLAERREFQKPVGLVGEIDVDPLQRHALLFERDHGALHIRAKLVADEFQ
ncbi:hypothetical protein ACVWZR_009096 [Bradyrhizobium sp. i1.3.1]